MLSYEGVLFKILVNRGVLYAFDFLKKVASRFRLFALHVFVFSLFNGFLDPDLFGYYLLFINFVLLFVHFLCLICFFCLICELVTLFSLIMHSAVYLLLRNWETLENRFSA